MISHINRVQAIKSKFENLSVESAPVKPYKEFRRNEVDRKGNKENNDNYENDVDNVIPASSLYKIEVKRSASDSKTTLTRQTSDPGKKLHRSHAFRCDRSQKLNSPKRHGSCNGRSETSEFLKMERKLSKDRLKRLGNVLEQQMKKENFTFKKEDLIKDEVSELSYDKEDLTKEVDEMRPIDSIPDEDVPPHILAQYAQVLKPKREEKHEIMTDSGVSSETENLDDDKSGRVKKITNQFEKTENTESKSNLNIMDFAGSSETMKLERKNPHLILTDTLKKALKQPLPPGPPPRKPPRTFATPEIDKEKSDTKRKLEKLEQVLLKREARKDNNIYDITEENVKKPKEVHYLCTELLDIQRNMDESPLKNCLNKLNCSVTTNSMSSLPYTRLSSNLDQNCMCGDEKSNIRTFMSEKCSKCHINDDKHGFKCHLKCECKKSEFFVDEHIYDEPYCEGRKSKYGTLNSLSKSLEDLPKEVKEDSPLYDEPCDQEAPTESPTPKTDFQKLRANFENNSKNPNTNLIQTKVMAKSTENVVEEKFKKRSDKKFATEVKRYKPREAVGFSLPKKNPQLDVDRENLNRLMNEIYETVTAACIMEENKPGSFPTDHSDTASEESTKLTRSLTEKRKNYVRRVSSRLAYLEPKNIKHTRYRHQTSVCSYKPDVDNPYSTFRSWKSFRTSQNNLTREKMEVSKADMTDAPVICQNDFDSDDSIDEKTGCFDIELPYEVKEGRLFNVCLVVGLNYMTGQAYVRNVFPTQVQVPQHIENLVFPETLVEERGERKVWTTDAGSTQCYSFVLTDERGERSYGYCRRVLPEGATSCLPLCYCLIGKYRAPGFYYKVLQELESHHGSSEDRINSVLLQLFDIDFPSPGEEITITYNKSDFTSHNTPTEQKNDLFNELTKKESSKTDEHSINDKNESHTKNDLNNSFLYDSNKDSKNSFNDSNFKTDSKNSFGNESNLKNDSKNSFNSSNFKSDLENSFKEDLKNSFDRKLKAQFSVPNASNFKEISDKCKTMPMRRNSCDYDYCDIENNNGPKRIYLDLDSPISKSLKYPLDPRLEETSSSQLLDSLGAGLLIKVFGSLLLERKIIIRADRLSLVSSHLEALQSCLYPFVWQQPLISLVPCEIQEELMHAPVPMLAGMLGRGGHSLQGFDEGMFIDLSAPSKVLFYQGDESTILPTTSYKTLKTSLQMESTKNKEKGDSTTRNLLISETFLRFFVDILGDFWKFFNFGTVRDGDLGRGDVVFDKDAFIKNAASKQNQYFLEWFTETAMFNHFIQNMAIRYKENYAETKIDPIKIDPLLKIDPNKVDPLSKIDPNIKMDYSDMNNKLIDTPTPNFYQLFEERVLARRNSKGLDRSGYKNALNKRVKLLKSRLKELVG